MVTLGTRLDTEVFSPSNRCLLWVSVCPESAFTRAVQICLENRNRNLPSIEIYLMAHCCFSIMCVCGRGEGGGHSTPWALHFQLDFTEVNDRERRGFQIND